MLDPLYIEARRVLLDALEALGDHRDVLILAGAQAIYLNTSEGDLAVSPFTTDGDIAIDPASLGAEPTLEEVMTRAGFRLDSQPGIWFGTGSVQIDLLVPESAAASARVVRGSAATANEQPEKLAASKRSWLIRRRESWAHSRSRTAARSRSPSPARPPSSSPSCTSWQTARHAGPTRRQGCARRSPASTSYGDR